MIDFFGSGYDAAKRLGLLPDLEQIHYPIDRLVFLDGHGREKFSIPYRDLRKLFGGRPFNFLRGDLEHMLYSKLPCYVDTRFGVSVESLEQHANGLEVRLFDGSTVRADLLAGRTWKNVGRDYLLPSRCIRPESSFGIRTECVLVVVEERA